MNPNRVRRNFATYCSALALYLGMAFMPLLSHAQESPKVKITTNMGEIMVELYPDKAPKTVANFLQYVRDKHYNGTIFHRVIANFMIQGGGYNTKSAPPARPFSTKAVRP
jgi:peptidyl-prolyl cis-trans isomerase A (cyclophilin A)